MGSYRFRAVVFAALIFAASGNAAAQGVSPYATPPNDSPISVSSPFVVSWNDPFKLACMTFTNVSNRTIDGIRFGITTKLDDPFSTSAPAATAFEVTGSFAPGVAIRPPTKFLGTVNRSSNALQNCWPTPAYPKTARLEIAVLDVHYADGGAWTSALPPQTLAAITY